MANELLLRTALVLLAVLLVPWLAVTSRKLGAWQRADHIGNVDGELCIQRVR